MEYSRPERCPYRLYGNGESSFHRQASLRGRRAADPILISVCIQCRSRSPRAGSATCTISCRRFHDQLQRKLTPHRRRIVPWAVSKQTLRRSHWFPDRRNLRVVVRVPASCGVWLSWSQGRRLSRDLQRPERRGQSSEGASMARCRLSAVSLESSAATNARANSRAAPGPAPVMIRPSISTLAPV